VLLPSPAIEHTRVAALVVLIDVRAVLPVPAFDKVHWQEMEPEFDPCKFNSFPVTASRQVDRATRALAQRLPPVVGWQQSVVDSTVGARGVVNVLYGRLRNPAHRLVMFDVNRQQTLPSVMRRRAAWRPCAGPRWTGRPAWYRRAMWRCPSRRATRSTVSSPAAARPGCRASVRCCCAARAAHYRCRWVR